MGLPPLYLAGREGESRRFGAALRSAPEIPANFTLTGLRGVGKTALLTKLSEIARDRGWAPAQVELEPRHNSEAPLVALVGEVAARLADEFATTRRIAQAVGRAAKSVDVSYGDLRIGFVRGPSEATQDLARVLYDSVTAANRAGREGVAVLLDEAQVIRDDRKGTDFPLSTLLAAVASLQREEVPISLTLCGLPPLKTHLLEARTYAERMFRGEEVSSLGTGDARAAFVEPLRETLVTFDEDLVERVVAEVDGYPYFIQLWGAELWDAADAADIQHFDTRLLDAVEPGIYQRLDRDFYEPRLAALTPAEQDLLLATATCSYPPLVVSELHSASPKTKPNVNVLLGRITAAGVLYRIKKGLYEFTAPRFHEYLVRRSGGR
ncbi:MAG: ATP-binding protein [Acidimicrobiia bacterium]|nr:ATP-binding protein [Acidimicrobiia bacterium]